MTRPSAGTPPVPTSAVARREIVEPRTVANYRVIAEAFQREDRMRDLRAMLGSDELVQRFLSVALHAVSTNSDLLLNADPISIIQAVKDSASLGLEPTGIGGEGWIIRYGRTATFRPGWQGYLKRVRNSGAVVDIDCQIVYENDSFEYGWTDKGWWHRHDPARMTRTAEGLWTGRGDYYGAYAYATMPSGFVEGEFMSTDQVNLEARAMSQSFQSGQNSPWMSHWSEMARKTTIRRLVKRLPQSAVPRLLVELEERADRLERGETDDGSAPRIDVSVARAKALAAVAGAATNTPIAPEEVEPEAREEPGAEPVPGQMEAFPVEQAGERPTDLPFDDAPLPEEDH